MFQMQIQGPGPGRRGHRWILLLFICFQRKKKQYKKKKCNVPEVERNKYLDSFGTKMKALKTNEL